MATSTVASDRRAEVNRGALWIRTGLLTALIDGTFSSVLSAGFYGSTVARLWQGVASTLIGPKAFEGGVKTALLGVLMHIGVAFSWSAVFLFILWRLKWIRQVVASSLGVLKVAALYGPAIWMLMSFVVIPLLTRRPPSITYRWWVQFFGHIPFVAVPIVASVARGQKR